MEATELLINRVSSPVLEGPAPTAEQLDLIYRAALRAPDHGNLKPWRFIQIEGEGRDRLADLFIEVAKTKNPDMSDAEIEKLRGKPLRAPMIIVVVAKLTDHPKVPQIEQQIAAGCAAHGILLAAFAQGVDAIWRTGSMAFDPMVFRGLGLEENEQITGFLYLGKARKHRALPDLNPADFVQQWGQS